MSCLQICVCVHPYTCGNFNDTQKPCTCAVAAVTKYQKRISGPILDRIDIHIEVPRVDYEKLSGDRVGETSASIRVRVQTARDIQTRRYLSIRNSNNEYSGIVYNADMRIGEIRQFYRVGCDETGSIHLAEALQYRPKLMLSDASLPSKQSISKL